MKAKVYFTDKITPESVLDLYKLLEKEENVSLDGNVCIKVHSGEKGNQNFIKPEFWKEICSYVDGTIVECNTAYDGNRYETKDHYELLKDHGWSELYKTDIMDEEGPDKVLDIENGKVIKKNYVGKNIEKYDSMLVLSHFKGHPMGGFGGAIKQLSIGVASKYGKAYIHGAGDVSKLWTQEHDLFLCSMADAASSVIKYFNKKIIYINVMMNMSVDCDCCSVAEDPCLKDIGVLISLDPVALDKACVDLVENSDDSGKDHFMERVNSRNGKLTLKAACDLGLGSLEYELIKK